MTSSDLSSPSSIHHSFSSYSSSHILFPLALFLHISISYIFYSLGHFFPCSYFLHIISLLFFSCTLFFSSQFHSYSIFSHVSISFIFFFLVIYFSYMPFSSCVFSLFFLSLFPDPTQPMLTFPRTHNWPKPIPS